MTTAACAAIAMVSLSAAPEAWAAAEETAALTVALDWHEVSQGLIDRCGLSGLENLLLEALIEQGFAVVADTGQQQVTLTLRTTAEGLGIDATRDVFVEHRHMVIGRLCDSTIAIEIVRIAKSALRAVVAARSAPPMPPAEAPVAPPVIATSALAPALDAPAREPWRFGLAAGVASVGADELAPTMRFEVARDLPAMLVGAMVVGASAWRSLGLSIIEPTLGAQLRRRVPLGAGWELAVGASAELLVHAYKYRDSAAGAVMSGRVGVPLELTFPHVPFALQLVPYARFRPIRQRVYEDVAFESGWFACDAVLKWVFD